MRLLRFAPAMLLIAVGGCSSGDRLNPATDSGVPGPNDSGETDTGEPADLGVPDTGASPTDSIIDLGAVQLGSNGQSETLTFDLPEDVSSFTVVIDGEPDPSYLVRRLEGPTGILVDDAPVDVSPIEQIVLGPFPSQFKSPNRVIPDSSIAAALFPNNPGVTVAGGTYSMIVEGATIGQMGASPWSGEVEVTVYYKAGAHPAGTLDVHLHYTGAGGLAAATAADDPLISAALTRLTEIYAAAGVAIGEISHHDIDASFSTVDTFDGPGNELSEMLRNSEGPGLHYFMVERIQSPFGGDAVGGIAGGLPGPPLHPGTGASGVAVALVGANGDPAVLAHIMAHEGGHWLGLFHTEEFFQAAVDQHPETPVGDQGQNFLMYPAVGGGQEISASQGFVLREHPEVNND